MSTKLAKELQKYFDRVGNRVVFRNGMSLNNMAMTMWERLGYREIDPSVLSRVLNGERLFSSKQIQIFSEILQIRSINRERLFDSYYIDIGTRVGIDVPGLRNQMNEVNYYEANLQRLDKLKRNVPFDVSYDWTRELKDEIEKDLKRSRDAKKSNILTDQLARSLVNLVWLNSAITTDWKRKAGEFKMICTKLNKLSKDLKNQHFADTASVLTHQYCFYLHDYVGVDDVVQKVDFENVSTDEWRVELYRGAVVANAHLKNEAEYRKIGKMILSRFSEYSNDLKAKTYQGLAYAEVLFGNTLRGRNFLDKSWYYLNLSTKDEDYFVQRRMQLISTELDFAKKFATDKNYLQKIGTEGLALTRFYKHRNYEKRISQKMSTLLN